MHTIERDGMSNTYRYQFFSHCPANDRPIMYSLEIETSEVIHVEHIVTACSLFESAYHEEIADRLHDRFLGRQTIKAHHHGVDIETRRGFEPVDCGRLKQRVQVGSTVYEKGTDAKLAVEAVNR